MAREKSYSPYSGFSVGAALLTSDGRVYTGANIENASFTPTVCAERVALFSAVHDGVRDFAAIAIVGAKDGDPVSQFCPPCGVCRQVLSEFMNGDFLILLYDGSDIKEYTLANLLPARFDLL
jgi:cytidine deaminase